MESPDRPIPVDELDLGMFVSRLDRPWLETPFLFQGFTIKDPREIAELKRYCAVVYVRDASAPKGARSNGQAPAARGSGGSGRPASAVARFAAWLRRGRRQKTPDETYTDTVSLKVEWKTAKEIHEDVSDRYSNVLERIRQGGKLDMRVLDTVVSPMVESVLRNRDALAWLSRIRQADDYTYSHSISCSIYAIALGRQLGLPKDDLNVLGLGALLLDVGKTRIPQELLAKSEALTDEERALVRRHVEFGIEILKKQPGPIDPRILEMVEAHHERYDGSGYPRGLSGLDIPVFARIAGLVDFYDAVVSARPYAAPMSTYDAVRELNNQAGILFQPEAVEQFVQAVGMFPNGALVELSTGEVGVVLEQNRVRRLRPVVLVVLDANKKPLKKSRKLDLRKVPSEHGARGAVWLVRGLEDGAYGIDATEFFL